MNLTLITDISHHAEPPAGPSSRTSPSHRAPTRPRTWVATTMSSSHISRSAARTRGSFSGRTGQVSQSQQRPAPPCNLAEPRARSAITKISADFTVKTMDSRLVHVL
ncbi:hypothetical protein HPB50_006101 [Hyalomma asiaticum]|uniref:Uncharacterized protein n=1 Tax=Hyalomma asiaticum TaxID=266040 RepID=A0ACB7RVS1_HYAAI|nr:hypothetical protein HPB50_006101 [Hyalomma asiaticum]